MAVIVPADVLACIERGRRFIIVSHERPDGDTLGSSSALACVLSQRGAQVEWWGRDAMAEHYSFLPCVSMYRTVSDAREARELLGDDTWTWVYLDVSGPGRGVGGVPPFPSGDVVVNIDHHVGNERFGTYNWISDAASTGEMVVPLFESASLPWGPEEATALYTAMATDTGFFRFSSVSGHTMRAAAVAIEHGADPVTVDDNLRRQFRANTLRLWGVALSRTLSAFVGRAIVSWLGADDFDSLGCPTSDTEGLVNMLLNVRSAELAALITPDRVRGGARISLRSRKPVNSRIIAESLGGGGHELAAGCSMPSEPEEAAKLFIELLSSHDEFRNYRS